MAEMLERIFVKPDTLPGGASCESAEEGYCELAGYGLVQVLGLAAAYAYVLFFASNLISDGAELLQMVPSLEHLVGSVVLPVLGAVPDGAIILFSGLAGDRALAQQQLSIGVGALAGSTIMLLSLPWALSVYAGRVNLDEHGIGSYKRPPGWRASERGPFAKLSPPTNASLRGTGVNCDAVVGHSAWVMVGTAALYLIAQLPAMTRNYRASSAPTTDEEALAVARFEKPFAIAGLAACSLCFVGYLAHKTFSGEAEAMRVMVLEEKRIQLIRSGHLTLVGAMGHLVSKLEASAASAGADGADGGGADAAVAAAVAARAAPRPFTRSGTSLRDELLAPLHGSAGSRAGAQHAAVPAPAQRRLSLSGQHAEILDEIRYTLRPFFHRCACVLLPAPLLLRASPCAPSSTDVRSARGRARGRRSAQRRRAAPSGTPRRCAAAAPCALRPARHGVLRGACCACCASGGCARHERGGREGGGRRGRASALCPRARSPGRAARSVARASAARQPPRPRPPRPPRRPRDRPIGARAPVPS